MSKETEPLSKEFKTTEQNNLDHIKKVILENQGELDVTYTVQECLEILLKKFEEESSEV